MSKRREYRKDDFDKTAKKPAEEKALESGAPDNGDHAADEKARASVFASESAANTASKAASATGAPTTGVSSATSTGPLSAADTSSHSKNTTSKGSFGFEVSSSTSTSGVKAGSASASSSAKTGSASASSSAKAGSVSNYASDSSVSPKDDSADEQDSSAEDASTTPASSDEGFESSSEYENVPPISPYDEYDLSGFDVDTSDAIERYLDMDAEYGKLPHPDVFNAYPPEIQRKIMEWTDRDVKARRDDESRRQDDAMRAEIERVRRGQMVPAIITVLALVCGAVTGIVTANPLFALVFMLVPLAVIAGRIAGVGQDNPDGNHRNKPPKM